MAAGIELAKAYVQIIPSAQGIKGMLEKELGGELDAAGKDGGKTFGSGLLDGVAGVAGAAAKATAVALGAATTAAGALAKASLDSYANYEQLVGGVETLFGAGGQSLTEYAASVGKTAGEALEEWTALYNGQKTVLDNAANAYQTAGLSANEYMETVTSFAAALVSSLGGDTEAAAQYADMAITDMADNANKMGTAIDSIQNAYQGFAKGNFTMLDNLKLGYGGTKEEMLRLLADAEKLSGIHYDISSYADIVDAIHVVQTEMGITGTTAAEASSTIQGSVSAAKSAWANLVTGIADENADLGTLIGNFVGSVETAAGNIVPRLTQILSGMGRTIARLAPVLAEQVPALITETIPAMVSAGAQLLAGLITGIVSAIPGLLSEIPGIIKTLQTAFSENSAALSKAGKELLNALVKGITEDLPEILSTAGEVIGSLVEGLSEAWPDLQASAGELFDFFVSALQENLSTMIEQGLQTLLSFSGGLRENAGLLVDSAITLIQTLADGLIEALPALIETVPLIVSNIAGIINDNAPKLLDTAASLIWQLVTGLLANIPVILDNIPQIIAAIWDTIEAVQWMNLGKNIMDLFKDGIASMWGKVKEAVEGAMESGINYLKGLKDSAVQWGKDMIQGLVDGIGSMAGAVWDAVNGIADSIAGLIHFSRPDTGPLRDYEQWMPDFMAGLAAGINANAWRVRDALVSLAEDMRMEMAPSLQMPALQPAAAGAAAGVGGHVTNLYQTIYTHDSLSESELTREAEDMLERAKWGLP